MARLIETAQRVFDLYEQNYAPNDRFLDIDDFKFHIATTYSTMLDKQFQMERKAGRGETGFSNVEISAQWMVEEVLTIEHDEAEDRLIAKTKQPVMSFRWDAASNALQGIHSYGANKHAIYRKLSLHERKFKQVLPVIANRVLFYLNTSQEIVFWWAQKGEKIKVQYIPAVVGIENDCLLADSIADEIVATLDLMFKSKNGNFIQKIDNQNPNAPVPQVVGPAAGK